MNASPSQAGSRVPTLLVLLLTALGIPGGLLALFKEDIPKHPWLTVGLVAAWEVLVLLGGLVTDVWSKLRNKWVDRLADWVDHRVTSLLSRYRRRYLKWIFYQHRDFDVKGLSTQGTYNLELEHVFVDLTVDPRPPHESSPNPIRAPELAGRRQIWDYLSSGALEGHFALLGAPGSGKTTLLKKIALQMAGRRRLRIHQTIPILLFLREHAEAIFEDPFYSVAEAVRASLSRKQGPRAPEYWFEARLEAGRCLVLLDGLDEVAALPPAPGSSRPTSSAMSSRSSGSSSGFSRCHSPLSRFRSRPCACSAASVSPLSASCRARGSWVGPQAPGVFLRGASARPLPDNGRGRG